MNRSLEHASQSVAEALPCFNCGTSSVQSALACERPGCRLRALAHGYLASLHRRSAGDELEADPAAELWGYRAGDRVRVRAGEVLRVIPPGAGRTARLSVQLGLLGAVVHVYAPSAVWREGP